MPTAIGIPNTKIGFEFSRSITNRGKRGQKRKQTILVVKKQKDQKIKKMQDECKEGVC